MKLRTAAPALLFTCLLPSQTAPAAIEPHVLIEAVGPDGWRARLGPTNLGVLLASEEGRAIWEPMFAPMLGTWAAMSGDRETYEEASARIFRFGGAVRVAARLGGRGPADLALSVQGDRGADLTAMAKDLRALIESSLPGEWQERQVGGRAMEVRTRGGDYVTAPRVEGGRMTMMLGDIDNIDAAVGLSAWLAARPTTLATPRPGSPAARVTFDLPALISLGTGDDEPAMLAALGLDALRELTITVGAAGPHVQLGADVEIDGPPRGLVKALMSPSQGVSALASLLPEASTAAKIARFDAQALVQGVLDAVEVEYEPAREETEDVLGVDPDADLFAHATDELLVLGAPLEDFDRAREATWALAWRLKDEAKFAAGFRTMMKKLKAYLSPSETTEIDGVELRRYGNLLRYDLWMGVGNGLWVLAAGRDAEEQLAELLRQAGAAQWQATAAPPRGFADLARYLPPGCNGFAKAELDEFMAMPSDWWLDLLPQLVAPGLRPTIDEDVIDEQAEATRALLVENKLARVRTATGSADGVWRWRLFW